MKHIIWLCTPFREYANDIQSTNSPMYKIEFNNKILYDIFIIYLKIYFGIMI
jgi:hypothetical protein